MDERENPSEEEGGTLLIAAILVLALAFAGAWVIGYVSGSGEPWWLARWFGIAAAVLVAVWLLVTRLR